MMNVTNITFKMLVLLLTALVGTVRCQLSEKIRGQLENPAVVKFRQYLQIDTSRNEYLQNGVEFWRYQATEAGLDFAVYTPAGKPICVLTRVGANPDLPSIMLNSHMDVVSAEPSEWTYPPFEAQVDENGNIYGRGAQDTKDIAIQYLEAVRRLIAQNVTLQRTIHITLMPDEETGGFQGIRPFLETPEYKALNIGFALDEGGISLAIEITVKGSGGHGSTMPADTAIKKLQKLINVMMEYRKPLETAFASATITEYGQYTTLNIDMIHGGVAANIIPETFTLVADLRLAPTENATEMLSKVYSWAAEAGNGTKVNFWRREMESAATPVDDSNPFWMVMKETINQMGYNLIPGVCPATTDMLPMRNGGTLALGFAPKRRTVSRAHAADEYLNVDIFLQGIDIYVPLITNLANVPAY